jgi:DNA-binding CsgD family transcriptional regulator
MMDRIARALELITPLTSAPTVRRAVETFEQAVEPFGVKIYHGVTRGNWTRNPVPIASVSNWPDEWRQFYTGTRAITFDPVVRALQQNDGFFWRDLPPAASQKGRSLMRDAVEFGMVDGFSAVRHVSGELATGFSLAGDTLDWNELEQGVVQFLSNSLMSRMLYLRDVRLTPAVKTLSPREADILSHAALGHDDRTIAISLGIKYTTVRHHWRFIRIKLDAADRAQAVAVGIWSGQILP